jgi:hypothetical protein
MLAEGIEHSSGPARDNPLCRRSAILALQAAFEAASTASAGLLAGTMIKAIKAQSRHPDPVLSH